MNSQVYDNFKALFRFFGFEPYPKKRRFSQYWLGLHMSFAIVQLMVIIKYRSRILYTFDRIGLFGDYIKLMSSICAYFVAIYVSWKYASCYRAIEIEVKNVSVLMKKLRVNVAEVGRRFIWKFRNKFVLLMTLQMLGILLQAISKYSEKQSIRFIAAFSIPTLFTILKYLHGLFYVEMMNSLILVLNDQIKQISVLITMNETKLKNLKYMKFLVRRLKICKNIYKILFNINTLQNKCMGLYFLINHVNFHIYFLSSFYWMTFRLFNQEFSILTCKGKSNDLDCILTNETYSKSPPALFRYSQNI